VDEHELKHGFPGPDVKPPPLWIDSHAHLERFPGEALSSIMSEANAAGVSIVLATATDLASTATTARLCTMFPGVYGAGGVSPFDVEGCAEDWEEQLRSQMSHDRMVAMGEIGLDRSNPRYPSIDLQLPVFVRQLAIAREMDVPVVVHSRGAERQVAEICRAQGTKKALFHCFTGAADVLEFIVSCGYHVSFSGIVTFNEAVLNLAATVPLERLFIETDCPYLAPAPHRGKTNCPAWVAITGETIAKSRGLAIETLQAALVENFDRLFLRR
jgi:TatD DNase family protein